MDLQPGRLRRPGSVAHRSGVLSLRPPVTRSIQRPLIIALAVLIGVSTLFAGLRSEAAATTTTIWAGTASPTTAAAADSSAVEVGTVFSSSTAGSVTAIRFYKGPGNGGTHVGKLWSNGTLLSSVTFTNESASGWQEATLAKPVTINAGQKYTVSYQAPQGRYAVSYEVFSSSATVKQGSLTAQSGVFGYGVSSYPTSTYRGSAYFVDVRFQAGTPTTAPTTAPAPTPPATTTPTTSSKFPDASNTGVPSSTALSTYTGPCTITAANTVIDAKTINCSLTIRAAGVRITRSIINGTVETGENTSGYSYVISDSEVRVGAKAGTGIGAVNFTALRVEVTGGNRSINCFRDCVIQDSYVHGQFRDATGTYHESGIRMGSNGTIRHNSLTCDAPNVPPDAGCSASLTGYGDFAAVQNNVIESNQFLPSTGGFCAYGGSSLNKPYSSQTRGIVFRNNVFQRGSGGKCGYYGPVTSFNTSLAGNVWTGNVWSDGGTVSAAN